MFNLPRSTLIKILAVVAAVLFITELFFFGGGATKFSSPLSPSNNVSGTSITNGTLRTYDPFLIIPSNTPQTVLDQLNKKSEVKSVTPDQQGYVVSLINRDDVYPLSSFLRDNGIISYSIANIALSKIVVQTSLGSVNANVPNGVLRLITEPLVDVDTEVPVFINAVVSDGTVLGYTSANLVQSDVSLNMTSTVLSLNSTTYTYSVPWEDRNNVGNLSGYGSVNYKKVDTVVFKSQLSLTQMSAKKLLPYVTYIDQNSVQVESNFNDLGKLKNDFNDTLFDLPPSKLSLIVSGNSLPPKLSVEPTIARTYLLLLDTNKTVFDFSSFSSLPLVISTQNSYTVGSNLQLNITGLVLGKKVIKFKYVVLPS